MQTNLKYATWRVNLITKEQLNSRRVQGILVSLRGSISIRMVGKRRTSMCKNLLESISVSPVLSAVIDSTLKWQLKYILQITLNF